MGYSWSELGNWTEPSLGQRAGAAAVLVMFVVLQLGPPAAAMIASTKDAGAQLVESQVVENQPPDNQISENYVLIETWTGVVEAQTAWQPVETWTGVILENQPLDNQVVIEVTFNRQLSGDRVGQHKAPPLSPVNMTITATVSSQVENATLADYFPSDWTVVDANGGIIGIYDENYDKIEWNVGTVSDSVSRSYVIRSPQRTLPPTKYYFRSELTYGGGSAVGDDWMVIVADPVENYTYVSTIENVKGTYENFASSQEDDPNTWATLHERSSKIDNQVLKNSTFGTDASNWSYAENDPSAFGSGGYDSTEKAYKFSYDDGRATVAGTSSDNFFINQPFTSPPGTFTKITSSFAYNITNDDWRATCVVRYVVRNADNTSNVVVAYDSGTISADKAWATYENVALLGKLEANTNYVLRIELRVTNTTAAWKPTISCFVDNIYLTFTTGGYDMEIFENINKIASGHAYYLEIRYKLDNTNDNFHVLVENTSNVWNYRYSNGENLSSTTWTVWSYQLLESELFGGENVHIKFVDNKPQATSATDLLTDYVRVKTLTYVWQLIETWTGIVSAPDTVAPPAPSLVSPADGTITDDPTPTFDWSDVTDPSGVAYDLEIIGVLTKTGLTASMYTLTSAEGLTDGMYSWRVRAVDGAGNVGDWSITWSLTIETIPPPPEGALTVTIGTITAGSTGSADFTQYGIAITKVRITAASTVSNVRVDVVVHTAKPAGVTEPALPAYSYFEISTTVGTAYIREATIGFQVPRSWMGRMNIDNRTICLLRFNGGWQRSPTSFVGADSIYFYYEATTSGFSVFAIVGERLVVPPPVEPTPPVTPPPVTPPVTPPMTPPPTPPVAPVVPPPVTPPPFLYAVLFTMAGVVGFAAAYRLLLRPSRYYVMLKRLERAVVRPKARRIGRPPVRPPVRVRERMTPAELAALRRLERIARERRRKLARERRKKLAAS